MGYTREEVSGRDVPSEYVYYSNSLAGGSFQDYTGRPTIFLSTIVFAAG